MSKKIVPTTACRVKLITTADISFGQTTSENQKIINFFYFLFCVESCAKTGASQEKMF